MQLLALQPPPASCALGSKQHLSRQGMHQLALSLQSALRQRRSVTQLGCNQAVRTVAQASCTGGRQRSGSVRLASRSLHGPSLARSCHCPSSDNSSCLFRWIKAVRTVVAQCRVTGKRQEYIRKRMASVEELAKPLSSIFGNAVSVPQLAVRFHSPAPARPVGHQLYRPPAPAELDAQVCALER